MQLSCRLPRKGQKMRINPLAPQDHIYLWTTSRRGKWRVCNTLTRVEADITSLLGTQAPTELCCKKCCRRIRQARSHNQVGGGDQGNGGGGDDSDGHGVVIHNTVQRQCGQLQSSRHKRNSHAYDITLGMAHFDGQPLRAHITLDMAHFHGREVSHSNTSCARMRGASASTI